MKDGDVQESCFEFFSIHPFTEMAPRRLIYSFYWMHLLKFDVVLSLLLFDVHFSLYSSIHHILF